MTLRLATRASRLAMAQSQQVADALKDLHGVTVEMLSIDSLADTSPEERIAAFGEEGVFVKALEQALLDGKADLAVHSLKDVPTEESPGLVLAAFLQREDPRDALVAKDPKAILDAPEGKRIGTSSLRRQAILRNRYPGIVMEDLRGNVDTRIDKALSGELDGVVVSLAGLKRLGRTDVPHHVFSTDELPPAVGQGVVVVQCRADDNDTLAKVAALNHTETELFARCEREFLREIKGGCLVPVGVRTSLFENLDLLLEAWIADPDGEAVYQGAHHQRKEAPEAVGSILASRLWQHGGKQIIHKVRGIQEEADAGDSTIEPAG